MNNFQNFAINLIARNPRFSNNPQAMNLLQVLQSGDNRRGEEIATNILNTLGLTREQGVEQAKRYLGL